MNETLRRDLVSTLQGWLVRKRTETEQAAFQTWKDQRASWKDERAAGITVDFLPSTLIMDVSHVLIVGETLFDIFDSSTGGLSLLLGGVEDHPMPDPGGPS